MNKQEYDALWWQYFAECGTSCGLYLPTRGPESVGVILGYTFSMMQAADASAAAGDYTLRGMLRQIAFKAPNAYMWFGRTFPALLRAAGSTFVSGGTTSTGGTVALSSAGRALTLGEAGVVGAGMLASAYVGFVVGAAAYASLRIRGFDFGAEGTTESDFFAWQTGNNNLSFFDWWGGALAKEQEGEDLRARLAKRKARTVQALARAEARHRMKVPATIYTKIRGVR